MRAFRKSLEVFTSHLSFFFAHNHLFKNAFKIQNLFKNQNMDFGILFGSFLLSSAYFNSNFLVLFNLSTFQQGKLLSSRVAKRLQSCKENGEIEKLITFWLYFTITFFFIFCISFIQQCSYFFIQEYAESLNNFLLNYWLLFSDPTFYEWEENHDL